MNPLLRTLGARIFTAFSLRPPQRTVKYAFGGLRSEVRESVALSASSRRGTCTVQTRELNFKDYDRILGLWEKSGLPSLRPSGRDSRNAFERQLESGITTVLGMEEGRRLIGVVLATHDGRKGWINRLVIDPDHRRKGYGRRLLTAAEKALSAKGMRIMAALIEDGNKPSLDLFQREGYRLAKDIHYLSKRESEEV